MKFWVSHRSSWCVLGRLDLPGLGVDRGPAFQEVLGQLQVSLLSRFHQGSWCSQLQVSSGLDQEVGNFQEAAATCKGQSSFLSFLRLRVDVGAYKILRTKVVMSDLFGVIPDKNHANVQEMSDVVVSVQSTLTGNVRTSLSSLTKEKRTKMTKTKKQMLLRNLTSAMCQALSMGKHLWRKCRIQIKPVLLTCLKTIWCLMKIVTKTLRMFIV